MGDELASYKAQIGNFHRVNLKKKTSNKDLKMYSDCAKWWLAATIIAVLLVMVGVERNPGPAKTIEDLDIKVNRIMEILSSHASETKTRLDDFNTKWTGLKKEVETMKQNIHKLKENLYELG